MMKHFNCVISAVGKNSLHRKWLEGRCDFDLHLVVYDDSMDEFRGDTDYLCHIKGYKLRVIYKYLEMHPEVKERYDYFFFPDDDIRMDAATINALFEDMRRYRLQIAQPALRLSYYTWRHTLKDRYCKFHYTNFVEMMVPCFSREALGKVVEHNPKTVITREYPVEYRQGLIPSMTRKIPIYIKDIRHWQAWRRMQSLVGIWLNIGIMTWHP